MGYIIKFARSRDYFCKGHRVDKIRATYYPHRSVAERILVRWAINNPRKKPLQLVDCRTDKIVTDSNKVIDSRKFRNTGFIE